MAFLLFSTTVIIDYVLILRRKKYVRCKMMRQNFDEVKAKLQTRGVKEEILVEFLRLDESRRDLLVKVEEMKNTGMMCLLKLLN